MLGPSSWRIGCVGGDGQEDGRRTTGGGHRVGHFALVRRGGGSPGIIVYVLAIFLLASAYGRMAQTNWQGATRA